MSSFFWAEITIQDIFGFLSMMLNYQSQWLQLLREQRAIAVIRAKEYQLGLAMARAIAAGGIRLIEITWNSDQPGRLISQLRQELPDCCLGTGTVLELKMLQDAIASGCQFIFTPHFNPELITKAINAEIPIIPGALSPTEIVRAWQAGATCVKVFPVQAVGGASYIQSLQGPLGQIPLIPTGGVTLSNAKSFLDAGAIAVGLSGELLPQSLIKSQNWQEITNQALILKQNLA